MDLSHLTTKELCSCQQVLDLTSQVEAIFWALVGELLWCSLASIWWMVGQQNRDRVNAAIGNLFAYCLLTCIAWRLRNQAANNRNVQEGQRNNNNQAFIGLDIE